MVEELKLAVKVDDDIIEQSLLKQFNNAEKLADKVVFTFKNVNLDNKEIEKQFKDMQKLAGKNPIELPIDTDKSLKMLQALGDEFTRIISIAKGLDGIKTDFGTKNKTEAYNQLKQMADVFKKFYGNEEAMHSKAGTDAAYAYYKAYEEALKKGVAQSRLESVTVDVDPDSFYNNRLSSDRIKDFESFKKYGGDITDLSSEILSLEGKLLDFADAYTKVKTTLGDAPITPDIIQNIEYYVELLGKARSLESWGDENDKETISSHRDSAQFWLDDALYKAKIQNEDYVASLKEVREEKEKTDEAIAHSSTPTVDDSKFDELKADVTEIREELNGVKEKISAIDSEGFEHVKADVEKTVESVRELNSELTEVKSKLDNTSASPVETNISSPMKDTFQGDTKVSAESSTPAVKDEAKAMEQVAESAEKASKGKDEFAKANKKVKESADSSSKAVSEETSEFNKIIGKLDGYNTKLANFTVKPANGNRYPIYQKNIDDLTEKINKLQILSEKDINLINTNDVEDAKALQKQIDELIFKMSKMSASEKGFDPLGADKALEKIHNELQKNSGMSKEAKRQIQSYYDEIRSGNPSKPIKDLLDDMYKLIQLEREAGRAHKSFNDIFKEKVIYGAAANLAGMIGIYDIINVGRQAVDIVIDLNTQITELAKVSEATSSQIYDDFNSYAEIAKDVGGTISDTISATADWSRNGYNIPDSKELAEVAMIYKNVGDGIDIDQANEYLISTLRGFNLEAKDAMSIIDSMNEVANNEPISASGIGEALQRSAAAFNAANTSLQESIALVTSTNSVLQSPEKVGSMWTTVSARIRGAKTELEDAGLETDGMVESTSKLQSMIKGMTGFDILESDGETFKSIYDIIIGIGDEFQNLSDLDQAKYNCLYVQKCA